MKTKNTKGFFLGLMLLLIGIGSIPTISLAQTFKQAGPINVGGRVRALLWDKSDPTHKTLYAGGVAGGLYVSTDKGESWHPVSGEKISTAAISCITQDNAGNIYVGTGEGFMNLGNTSTASNNQLIGRLGCGIFVKKAQSSEFVQLQNTIPEEYTPTDKWSYVNELACAPSGVVYAATNKGIMYSLDPTNETGQWTESSVNTGTITATQDINIQGDVIYFSQWNSTVNGFVVKKSTEQDLSGSTVVFSRTTKPIFSETVPTSENVSGNPLGRIEIATTPLDANFVYISVMGQSEWLGVFVSENKGGTWRSITPDSYKYLVGDGNYSNTLVIDPRDKEKIYGGGYALGLASDYNQEGYYYWDQISVSSYFTAAPNSSDVNFSSFIRYLHQDIHSIVFSPDTSDATFFVATDGGISYFGKRKDGYSGFQTSNKGLNITQFYSVTAANDGSVMAGTQGNGSVYIATPSYDNTTLADSLRIALSDSSRADIVAFSVDPTSEGVLLLSSGGYTNSSMFQPIEPKAKKNFFLTQPQSLGSRYGIYNFARAYGDYYNYAGSQAWNYGSAFINSIKDDVPSYSKGEVTVASLWETTNGTAIYDSVYCKLRTGMYVYKPYTSSDDNDIALGKAFTTVMSETDKYTVYTLGKYDTDKTINEIKNGYKVFVRSNAHFDYPFLYTFTANYPFDTVAVKADTISFKVHNPVQNRYFVADGKGIIVVMSPTDFTQSPATCYRIFALEDASIEKVQNIVVSNDGNHLFVTTNSIADASSKIYRCSNVLNFRGDRADLSTVAIKTFTRPVTSFSIDPQDNNKMLISFGNITAGTANIRYATNALTAVDEGLNDAAKVGTGLDGQKVPVYATLIEMNNSNTAFIGTDKGLYVTKNLGDATPVWELDATVKSPVYMITQQINNIAPAAIGYPSEGPYQGYSWTSASNFGAVYVATYGKGIYYSTDYLRAPSDSLIGIKQTTLSKKQSTSSLKVYPNPAKDNANIEFMLSRQSNVSVRIYSLSGNLIYNYSLGTKPMGKYVHPINCSNLPKGVSIIQVVTDNEVMTSKIIIN